VLLATTHASQAHADDADASEDDESGASTVSVRIITPRGMGFVVLRRVREDWQEVDRCPDTCTVDVAPGLVRIRVRPRGDDDDGSRTIWIDAPTRIVIDPPSSSDRTLGGVLAIGGAISLFAGSGLFMNNASVSGGECSRCSSSGSAAGLGMMLTGLVLTPVGLGLVLGNTGPSFDIQRGSTPRREVAVSVAPASNGGVVVVGGSF
jgi:hypothetical protein